MLLLLLVLRNVRLSVRLLAKLGRMRGHAAVVVLVLLVHRRVLVANMGGTSYMSASDKGQRKETRSKTVILT